MPLGAFLRCCSGVRAFSASRVLSCWLPVGSAWILVWLLGVYPQGTGRCSDSGCFGADARCDGFAKDDYWPGEMPCLLWCCSTEQCLLCVAAATICSFAKIGVELLLPFKCL